MEPYTVYLGAAALDEPLPQPGDPDFHARNEAECRAFLRAIRELFGEPPEGAILRIRTGEYDFGIGREVVIEVDLNCTEACRYSQICEEFAPRTWAEADVNPVAGQTLGM